MENFLRISWSLVLQFIEMRNEGDVAVAGGVDLEPDGVGPVVIEREKW